MATRQRKKSLWQRTIETIKQADKARDLPPHFTRAATDLGKTQNVRCGHAEDGQANGMRQTVQVRRNVKLYFRHAKAARADFQDDKTLRKQVLPLHMKKQLMEQLRDVARIDGGIQLRDRHPLSREGAAAGCENAEFGSGDGNRCRFAQVPR